jgi:hypothetical protein
LGARASTLEAGRARRVAQGDHRSLRAEGMTTAMTERPKARDGLFRRCGCTEVVLDDDGRPMLTAAGKPKRR